MSPRTGRPKSDNPLSVDIKVRVNRETNDKLIEYCEKYGVSRTEVIRKGIDLVLKNEKNRALPP